MTSASKVTPELTVANTRHTDGSTILRLTRGDGSATWQRNRGVTGQFFPPHDLTHLAVETVLGHRRGFYGLVVEGWGVDDFGPPWPRGRLTDIDPSELIVGFLDRTGLDDATAPDAAELNRTAALYFAERPDDLGGLARWRDLTDDELAAVRREARALIARWHEVPPGGTLTLDFSRAPA